MEPNDGYSIARRTLDVEDYIDIMRRHRGWIFGPFLFCVVASVVGVYLWPDSYESQAIVKITPQQIPESMVQSSINQAMLDRISSMTETIESRAVLTNMINNFNLYPRERTRMPIDDVVDLMKSQIHVNPLGNSNPNTRSVPAFAVMFSYEDRHLAQRVVQDLVSRFIDENVRNRSGATFSTTQFMKDELADAKKDLDVVESKIAAFRTQNNGRLPDQMMANMQSLQQLQSQTGILDASVSRANQERLTLESNLRIVQNQISDLKKTPPQQDQVASSQRNEKLTEAEREVQHLQDVLRALLQQDTEANPDVKNTRGLLKLAEQKRDDLLKQDAEAKKALAHAEPSPRQMNPQVLRDVRSLEASVAQIQTAIANKDLEIADLGKQMKRANELMKIYSGHIEAVPMGEKEYDDLLRDQALAKERYVQLEQRLEHAEISQQMENRNEGERLEPLDPANLPLTPTQPKRGLVISIGAGIGLLLGMVIAGGREVKDTSLKNLKDVRAYTQMAILGSIPLLENDFVVRRRRRLAWLGWTTACLAAVVTMAGSIVYYYTTRQ